VEEKLEKPTILVCLIYITGTEGMGWHSDARKLKKKWSYRLCKFWCRTKIYLQTQRQQGNSITELIHGSLLVMKDPNSLAAPLTSHYTHYYS
jgi:hypothetical protein